MKLSILISPRNLYIPLKSIKEKKRTYSYTETCITEIYTSLHVHSIIYCFRYELEVSSYSSNSSITAITASSNIAASSNSSITFPQMSGLVTKPTKWLCAQRRPRSACASAQSDQSLCCALNGELRTQAFFMRTAKTDQNGRMRLKYESEVSNNSSITDKTDCLPSFLACLIGRAPWSWILFSRTSRGWPVSNFCWSCIWKNRSLLILYC